MKILGRHLLVEYSDCDRATLNNSQLLEQYINEAVRESGATIVRSVFHRYNPQGVSGVVVIAESHFSVHTWPEYGYAAVDFFTCGGSVDPHKAHKYLQKKLGTKNAQVMEVKRGIPSATDEIISHKTTVRPAVPVESTRLLMRE
ncbi:MAG: adenosylmethionine decarboxylase [candidate division Zixibacteria bacterium]|nr:adenosylmethionine decarboxylase [candidate division Zixibacteria bacterium]